MDAGATLTAALLDVCRALNGARVPYCLAGGLAVSMLTTPRATADIDVVVSDNMATKTRRHEEIAAPYLVNCAATACCALTTKTIISVASASSCLGAFVANLFAAALIPVVGGIHATLKTENCKL